MMESDVRVLERIAAIQSAILVVLRERPHTACDIGRRVFQERGPVATGRAMGRLLAMRQEGVVKGKVDGARPGAAKWRITAKGLEWLRDVMAIKEEM